MRRVPIGNGAVESPVAQRIKMRVSIVGVNEKIHHRMQERASEKIRAVFLFEKGAQKQSEREEPERMREIEQIVPSGIEIQIAPNHFVRKRLHDARKEEENESDGIGEQCAKSSGGIQARIALLPQNREIVQNVARGGHVDIIFLSPSSALLPTTEAV